MIIAGEVSGDLHGANLVRALKKLRPGIRFSAVGGKKMREAGVDEIFFDIKNMAVVGGVEVIGKIGFLFRVYRKIVREIKKKNLSALILIDYPTFNLFIARIARKNGVPVFYYISPQLWAWRPGRIKKISQRVDKMLVILPFEEKIYQASGIDVEFVGHPFLDLVKVSLSKKEIAEKFKLDPEKKCIGLLPGSRKNELDYLLPLMLQSVRIMKEKFPALQFLLLLSDSIERGYVEERIKKEALEIKIIQGDNYEMMAVSDLLIVASGSATLEAGLLNTPMIIIYKVNFLTYWLGKLLVKVKNIGLVNIVAGKVIVPELLQNQVRPDEIVRLALKMLRDGDYYNKIKEDLSALRASLGQEGAAFRAAESILRKLNKGDAAL